MKAAPHLLSPPPPKERAIYAPTTSSGDLRLQALHLVNLAREAINLPPLSDLRPGSSGAADSCPLARSLFPGASVGTAHLCSTDPSYHKRLGKIARVWGVEHPGFSSRIDLPETLKLFVNIFDFGCNPALKDLENSPRDPLPHPDLLPPQPEPVTHTLSTQPIHGVTMFYRQSEPVA